MVESSVADIIESVRQGDRAALARIDWARLPGLQNMLSGLGSAAKLTAHEVDSFARLFRGSRDYLGYLLHALAGADKDIHRMPESFTKTLQSLDKVLDLPQAERLRWIERAAAVSDSVGELHWLLLMQLAAIGQARWLIDPAWSDATRSAQDLPTADCLRARLISFAVHGANYRLSDDWVERDSSNVEGEAVVQFGWTDEDKESIIWCDSRQELHDGMRAQGEAHAVVRSFASLPLFYSTRMLEAVVVFQRGPQAWDWTSVNGLSPKNWCSRLLKQGVDAATIGSLTDYYDALRTRLLPAYRDHAEGDLLISLAFSVVPRALGADGRRAATVFAKLLLDGGEDYGTLSMSPRQIHGLALGLWRSVNHLKVPVLRRLTAEVLDTTSEKSARLAQQAVLFDDLRLRLRGLAHDASGLEQQARELNLQIAGSAVDMDLPYARVAQLFDETYTLESHYRQQSITIKHLSDSYTTSDAQWVLCAALSDLMGQPREVDPTAVGARRGGAAWTFLSDPEHQLGLRLDALLGRMRNGVWGANHIAALVMNLEDVRLPLLPERESEYNEFQSRLSRQPQLALDNLKSRFFDMGRSGSDRVLELHVLAPRIPLTLIGDFASPAGQHLWNLPLWNSGAFGSPAALLKFLQAIYEKMSGRRGEHVHPLRVRGQLRCELSQLPAAPGDVAWQFKMPGQTEYTFSPESEEKLRQHVQALLKALRDDTAEVRDRGRGDILGPFTDLLQAVKDSWLDKVQIRYHDGSLSLEIPHRTDAIGRVTRITTGPSTVEISQWRCP